MNGAVDIIAVNRHSGVGNLCQFLCRAVNRQRGRLKLHCTAFHHIALRRTAVKHAADLDYLGCFLFHREVDILGVIANGKILMIHAVGELNLIGAGVFIGLTDVGHIHHSRQIRCGKLSQFPAVARNRNRDAGYVHIADNQSSVFQNVFSGEHHRDSPVGPGLFIGINGRDVRPKQDRRQQ